MCLLQVTLYLGKNRKMEAEFPRPEGQLVDKFVFYFYTTNTQ